MISRNNDKNPFGQKGWLPERLKDQRGKTFVITGTTTGIGYEATKLLLKKGAEVVMLNRPSERAENLVNTLKAELDSNIKVRSIVMDMASMASIRRGADELLATTPKIDALICNAAISQGSERKFTADGLESQIGTNHYGHFLLCNLVFERIDNSAGRLVFVGSNGYKMGLKRIQFEDLDFEHNYAPMRSYTHSKLVMMTFAYELQRRIAKAGKKAQVQVCHPGASNTMLSKEESSLKAKIFFALFGWLLKLIIVQKADAGSWPMIMCCVEDNLKYQAFYGPTQRADMLGAIGECALEPHVLEEDAAKTLWTISEQKTHCSWLI